MLTKPMDILAQYPVRRSKAQKQAFRDAVQTYAENLNYPVSVESGKFGSRNLIIGDPETAKYLVTAHYDTCAKIPFPNLLTPFSPVLFLLYQLLIAALLLLGAALLSFLVCACVFLACLFLAPLDSGLMIVLIVFLLWYVGFVIFGVLFFVLLYFGPANKNNANDNTSGVVTLLEIARTMPETQRHKVCFVLFDLEEKGLWGSRSFRKLHKETSDHQIVLNLDCVGDGDHIRMFPTKKLKENRKMCTSLYNACGYMGKKSILVHEKGFGIYPSDQRHFPYGVGICALRKNKLCYYLGRIHTKRDTVLDEINVNILRAALTSFICCDAVNQERKMKNETV